MKKINKKLLTLFVVTILGVLIYQSPDDSYYQKKDTQDPIKIGRKYARNLLIIQKHKLLPMSVNPAKEKIEHWNFESLSMVEAYTPLKKQEFSYSLHGPIIAAWDGDEEVLELAMLERLDDFIVMTFAFKPDLYEPITEIPNQGKMLFSIGLRYVIPPDDRLVPKLIRKIANLPLLNNITGNMGTTGRWVVFDFNYQHNLRDYLAWVEKEGENYSQQQQKETEEFNQQLRNGKTYEELLNLDESVSRSLDFSYKWGSDAVVKQIAHIELMSGQQEEFKNTLPEGEPK